MDFNPNLRTSKPEALLVLGNIYIGEGSRLRWFSRAWLAFLRKESNFVGFCFLECSGLYLLMGLMRFFYSSWVSSFLICVLTWIQSKTLR